MMMMMMMMMVRFMMRMRMMSKNDTFATKRNVRMSDPWNFKARTSTTLWEPQWKIRELNGYLKMNSPWKQDIFQQAMFDNQQSHKIEEYLVLTIFRSGHGHLRGSTFHKPVARGLSHDSSTSKAPHGWLSPTSTNNQLWNMLRFQVWMLSLFCLSCSRCIYPDLWPDSPALPGISHLN